MNMHKNEEARATPFLDRRPVAALARVRAQRARNPMYKEKLSSRTTLKDDELHSDTELESSSGELQDSSLVAMISLTIKTMVHESLLGVRVHRFRSIMRLAWRYPMRGNGYFSKDSWQMLVLVENTMIYVVSRH
jgi:hypothetical protein